MTETALIGTWAARFDGEAQVTRWHYIESQIADRVVTHCGRQLPSRTKRGHLLIDGLPAESQKCARCAIPTT